MTEEHRRKIGLANKGKKRTAEWNLKNSLAHKGKPLSEEHKRKIALSNRGQLRSEETKRNISLSLAGRKLSVETKQKLSAITQAQFSDPESRNRHSEGLKLWRARPEVAEMLSGDTSPAWKGDEVGYQGLHAWGRKNIPKPDLCQTCELCPPTDLANKSGKYLRDVADWLWVCHSCNMLDGIPIHARFAAQAFITK